MRVTTDDLSAFSAGTRLRRVRLARGIMSCRELAEKSGLSKIYIANYEANQRSWFYESEAKAIAAACRVSVDRIFKPENIREDEDDVAA